MSGLKRKIYERLPKRAETQRKGAICQERKIKCHSGKRSLLSNSHAGSRIGRYTKRKSFSLGSDLKQRDVITRQRPNFIKNGRKNSGFIRLLELLLKEHCKMDKELIDALAIAISCLKSKLYDPAIIHDLDEVLKKHKKESNEEIQNGKSGSIHRNK